MILVSAILINVVFVIAIGFWHRSLIVQLYTTNLEAWQQLHRDDSYDWYWPLTLRLPIWSWTSLYFFIFKKYQKLRDANFSARARLLRLALIAWLIQVCVGPVIIFYYRHS
jgi:hypothetical protein